MVVERYHQMGVAKSRIRVLFEYGMAQAAKVGKENVFDFSIGNPSVPAPAAVADTVRELLEMDPIALHGYTPAGGCAEARESIAADLTKRTGTKIRPENIFFTCGAAPAMTSCMQALAVENAEFLLLAPYFSEYPAYAASTGAKCVVVPPDTEHFQVHVDEVVMTVSPSSTAFCRERTLTRAFFSACLAIPLAMRATPQHFSFSSSRTPTPRAFITFTRSLPSRGKL